MEARARPWKLGPHTAVLLRIPEELLQELECLRIDREAGLLKGAELSRADFLRQILETAGREKPSGSGDMITTGPGRCDFCHQRHAVMRSAVAAPKSICANCAQVALDKLGQSPLNRETVVALLQLAASAVVPGAATRSPSEIEAQARKVRPSRLTSPARAPIDTLIAGCKLVASLPETSASAPVKVKPTGRAA